MFRIPNDITIVEALPATPPAKSSNANSAPNSSVPTHQRSRRASSMDSSARRLRTQRQRRHHCWCTTPAFRGSIESNGGYVSRRRVIRSRRRSGRRMRCGRIATFSEMDLATHPEVPGNLFIEMRRYSSYVRVARDRNVCPGGGQNPKPASGKRRLTGESVPPVYRRSAAFRRAYQPQWRNAGSCEMEPERRNVSVKDLGLAGLHE